MREWMLLIFALALCFLLETGAQDKTDKYLLPDTVWPVTYIIKLHTHLAKCRKAPKEPCAYEGDVIIEVNVKETIEKFRMHSFPNIKIKKATVKKSDRPLLEQKHDKPHDYMHQDEEGEEEKEEIEEKEENDGENEGEHKPKYDHDDAEMKDFLKNKEEYHKRNKSENGSPPKHAPNFYNGGSSNQMPAGDHLYFPNSEQQYRPMSQQFGAKPGKGFPPKYGHPSGGGGGAGEERLPQGTSAELIISDYDKESQMLEMSLSRALSPGMYIIMIKFDAKHSTDNEGFYITSNEIADKKNYLLSTQFEPDRARRAFPCFDEPRFKARFQIFVDMSKKLANEGYHVLSNMPLQRKINYFQKFSTKGRPRSKKSPKGEKRVSFMFYATPIPMSTYLVAFVVSDYVASEPAHFGINDTKKPFTTWAPKGFPKDRTYNGSQFFGPLIADFYADLYNVSFAFPKIDQISIPNFVMGAMENWGLITYRHEILIPSQKGSVNSHLEGIITIAHELAHQWFGNLVTAHWWNDIWLNEGFASFHEGQLGRIKTKEVNILAWDSIGRFISTSMQSFALVADMKEDAPPLSFPVFTSKAINDRFDAITYAKGGSILRMWKLMLGDDIFFASVSRYLKDNALGIGTPEALMKAFNMTLMEFDEDERPRLPADVEATFADWYRIPGYPVLKVKAVEDKKIIITQERFLLNRQRPDATNASQWHIPLTYSTSMEANFESVKPVKYFKKGSEETHIRFARSGYTWYLLNNQMGGFYRVLYDEKNWDALRDTLLDAKSYKTIHKYNRAQIIDDACTFSLVNSTTPYMSFVYFLNVTQYLKHERSFVPWRAYSRNIRYILDGIIKSKSVEAMEAHKILKKFAMSIIETRLEIMKNEKLTEVKDQVLKEELIELQMYLKLGHKNRRAKKIAFFDSGRFNKNWEQVNLLNGFTGEGILRQKNEIIQFIKQITPLQL